MNQADLIEQAKVEARAKVIWGESPKQVIFFLRTRGVSLEEAIQITEEAFAERVAEARGQAIKQIVLGICLQALPVGGYFIYAAMGTLSIISMVIFGLACAGSVYGLYCLVSGIWTLCVSADDDEESSGS